MKKWQAALLFAAVLVLVVMPAALWWTRAYLCVFVNHKYCYDCGGPRWVQS